MRRLPVFLALAGLALATAVVAHDGAGRVVAAGLSVGPWGFALAITVQLALYPLLAEAWHAACPDFSRRTLLLARMVREAGTNNLPFSHLGGIAFGVQVTATAEGAGFARGFAANVLDVTFESLGQVVFIAAGIAALVCRAPDSRLAVPLGAGLPVMVAAIAALVWLQRRGGRLPLRRLFAAFSRRLARQWQAAARRGMGEVAAELDGAYAAPGRLAIAAVLHALAWFGGAGWTLLALRLLGAPAGALDALAIEGVVSGVLTLSFVVPGHLGVQEAAYAALAAAVGVPAEMGVALSLLRRAKDLAIGVPVLLAWQGLSVRRLAASPAGQPLSGD